METDTRDLLKKRINEGLEKLEELDDPTERKKKVDEIKTLSDIDAAYERNENDKYNNNWKNELDEQKLKVDEAKLKTDRARIWVDVGKTFLYGICGFGTGVASYFLGSFLQKDAKLERFGEKLNDFMMRK